MNTSYWKIDKSDLDAKAGQSGFDAYGVHDCCREYENDNDVRKSPVPSLGLGEVVTVFLKCDEDIDMVQFYPSAISHSLEDSLIIVNNKDNHFFNPADDV